MLDIKLLIISSFFSLTVLVITSCFLSFKFPNEKYFHYFKLFAVSFLIGQILASSRNIIPDLFSIIIGNSLLVIGYIFLYIGIRDLLNLEAKWNNRYFIPIGVVFLGFIIFTYISYDVTMRIVIFSIFCTIYGSVVASLFWQKARNDFLLFDKISSLFFISGVVLFAIRTIKASMIQLPANYLNTTDLLILLVYVYLFFISIWLSIILIVQGKISFLNKKRKEKI